MHNPRKKAPAQSLRTRARMMPFSAGDRCAPAMLATSGHDGVAQAWLSAHGFDASMIAGLVTQGIATITAEKVRADGKLVAVAKVRITESGREALAASRSAL